MKKALKLAIVATGIPAWQIARKVGLSETVLSRIVRGRREASLDERDRLARTLGIPEDDLFAEDDL